jgi:hypothetical protein
MCFIPKAKKSLTKKLRIGIRKISIIPFLRSQIAPAQTTGKNCPPEKSPPKREENRYLKF